MNNYNLRHSKKRKSFPTADQPKGRKQSKVVGQSRPLEAEPDMADEVSLADIYKLLRGVETRMVNVEDCVIEHTNTLNEITGNTSDGKASVNEEVFISDGEDDEHMDDNEIEEVPSSSKKSSRGGANRQYANTGARPKVPNNNNGATSRSFKQPRGGGARGGARGRGRGGNSNNKPSTRRASVGSQSTHKPNQASNTQPRRSSTSGSSFTHAQRKELMGMVTNKLMRQRAHDDLASFQVVIHGCVRNGREKFEDEAKTALGLLKQIYPHCNIEDIDQIHRFPKEDDDGTNPLCITFERRSMADILIEKWQANRSKFPWFAISKSKEVRRFNALEAKAVNDLNTDAPSTDALIWELKEVGSLEIRRRVPNPNYKPPAIPEVTVAGHKTQTHPQWTFPTHRNPSKMPPKGAQEEEEEGQ